MSDDIMLTMKKLWVISLLPHFSTSFIIYVFEAGNFQEQFNITRWGQKTKNLNIQKYFNLQGLLIHQFCRVLLKSKVNLCVPEVNKVLGAYLPQGNKWALQTKPVGK